MGVMTSRKVKDVLKRLGKPFKSNKAPKKGTGLKGNPYKAGGKYA